MGGQNPCIENAGKQAVDAIPFILMNPFSLFTTEPYIAPHLTPTIHTETLKSEWPSFTSKTYKTTKFCAKVFGEGLIAISILDQQTEPQKTQIHIGY